MCTMIGYRFLSCSSPPFLLVFLSKCKRQTCRCIHNYPDILILSTNNSCATSARPVIFVIVIRHEIVARARAQALEHRVLYTYETYIRKRLDHLLPTVVCLQNAAEVSNVTPPCQLLSRITTHDLFPLVPIFFISALDIPRDDTIVRMYVCVCVTELLITDIVCVCVHTYNLDYINKP